MLQHYLEIVILAFGAIILLSVVWSAGTKRNPWALVLVVLSFVAGFFIRDRRDKIE